MKPTHPITIDSHSAAVLAGMMKGYASVLSAAGIQPILVEGLLCDEIDQALKMRRTLLEAIAKGKAVQA